MLKIKKIKMLPILVFALLVFAFSGRAISADLDIFDMTPKDVHPNVLIVLDLSGSMGTNKDVPNAAGNDDYRINVAKAVLVNLISKEENKNIRWGLMTFPYSYTTSTVMGGSRLIAECKPRVFDPLNVQGAEPYAGQNGVRYLINTINGLSPNGGTPVASALAEAGLYYAGTWRDDKGNKKGGSFFWTGTYDGRNPPTAVRTSTTSARMEYKSPIENECQNNYIILVTDGFSSVDSGKLGRSYYNDNYIDKYGANIWNDSIFFMDDYLPGVKIDGNKDPNDKNNKETYGYITWKSKFSSEDIGKQLEDVKVVWKWSAYDSVRNPGGNKLITREVTGVSSSNMSGDYSNKSPYLRWPNIISGNPLKLGSRLEYSYVNQLFLRKIETEEDGYVYGYNADDPSRSIPPFPVAYPITNNVKRTSIPLYNQGYIQGTQIFQGNQWEAGNFASDYLDDVAAILYNEDLRPDLGTGTKYEKQRVKTYVIGFRFSSDLLDRAAIMGSGGAVDKAMTADAYDELETALNTIMTSIKEEMAVFASPSLPASGDNELYTGKILYMGLFKPSDGFWVGNLKRYDLDDKNTMSAYLDANGAIKTGAKSAWNPGSEADSSDVGKGGVSETLNKVLASMVGVNNTKDLRKVYTYTNTDEMGLAHENNLLIENNSKLTPAMLDLETSEELQAAVTSIRLTPMGAIMHSTPAQIYHGTEKVVYVGSNDGFLHAFHDQDSHVSEAWAFVMPEHLPIIKTARDVSPNSRLNQADGSTINGVYFVDGSISHKTIGSEIILIAGARRGGNNYVALNVANFNQPVFKYEITPERVGWSIGQSWGNATFIDGGAFVLLPGGYDARYDATAPKKISDAKGAGIMGLTSSGGVAHDRFHSLHGGMMQHSTLDFAVLDSNEDATIDTIYYGDLGGHLFYATSLSLTDRTDEIGGFTPYLLFETNIEDGRRFMSAPALLKVSGIEYVYFGSGDRETPLDREVLNRFYCVKNFYKHEEDGRVYLDTSLLGDRHLSEGKMYDASKNLAGSADETTSAKAKGEMDASPGWYFDLEEGEKVVGTAAYKEFVIFTTYQPEYDELPDATDICRSGGSTGKGRMYIINYLYGTGTLGEKGDERSVVIGNTIPSSPVVSIFQVDDLTINVKVTVTIGLEDVHGNQSIGVIMKDLGEYSGIRGALDVFYWREIF